MFHRIRHVIELCTLYVPMTGTLSLSIHSGFAELQQLHRLLIQRFTKHATMDIFDVRDRAYQQSSFVPIFPRRAPGRHDMRRYEHLENIIFE
jgi:hypothetical protein